jgi:hypothetical protein
MRVAEVWKRWSARRAAIREIDTLDARERDVIAAEIGVTTSMLQSLVSRDTDSSVELERLANLLRIDLQHLRRIGPSITRDMDVICSLCILKAQCRSDLDSGRARTTYVDYCPNAPTLDALAN